MSLCKKCRECTNSILCSYPTKVKVRRGRESETYVVVVVFDAAYHLVGEHEHSFERKLPFAVVEEVFKTGAKQVDNHHVVVALNAEPMHVRDAHCSKKKGQISPFY